MGPHVQSAQDNKPEGDAGWTPIETLSSELQLQSNQHVFL